MKVVREHINEGLQPLPSLIRRIPGLQELLTVLQKKNHVDINLIKAKKFKKDNSFKYFILLHTTFKLQVGFPEGFYLYTYDPVTKEMTTRTDANIFNSVHEDKAIKNWEIECIKLNCVGLNEGLQPLPNLMSKVPGLYDYINNRRGDVDLEFKLLDYREYFPEQYVLLFHVNPSSGTDFGNILSGYYVYTYKTFNNRLDPPTYNYSPNNLESARSAFDREY